MISLFYGKILHRIKVVIEKWFNKNAFQKMERFSQLTGADVDAENSWLLSERIYLHKRSAIRRDR